MHEGLLSNAPSLTHDFAGSSYRCSWLQNVGKGLAYGWAKQMGLLEHFLLLDDVSEEVVVHTVQNRLGAIVVRKLSYTFARRMVPLGAEACPKEIVFFNAVHDVSDEVNLRCAVVQHDVDLLVVMKAFLERIRVEQNVWRAAENSGEVGQELLASHVQWHYIRFADDVVAKQSQHIDRVHLF